MNGKRQTIWLVSMLSLMVVLSAYYLFTEDSGVSSPKETAGTIQVDSVKDAGALPSTADSGAAVSEVTSQNGVDAGQDAVTDPAAADPSAADDTAAGQDAASSTADDSGSVQPGTKESEASADPSANDAKTQATATAPAASAKPDSASTGGVSEDDAAVLDKVASQSASASSMFNNYLYEREQKNLKEHDDLMAMINDMDKSPADSAAAQEQLSKLEDKEAKISGIEVQLQQQYGEAIVKEEANDFYKVVVLSDKLDVKQAVGIVDLVMKELSVSQDKVSVQHVSEQ